jgi:RNA polymerase sigma-70 factor, ECF subfamily
MIQLKGRGPGIRAAQVSASCGLITKGRSVGLSEIDRNLLERCLQNKPRAWEDFVDRFMGLVVHVIRHTAQARSVRLSAADQDDFCAEVFLAIIKSDFAILRNFRGQSSLATYLTVVARRSVVREMLARKTLARLREDMAEQPGQEVPDPHADMEQRVDDRQEVEQMLDGLPAQDATVVRMFHLQGRSYQEIGEALGMPENSVGPILSRARQKLRRASVNSGAR